MLHGRCEHFCGLSDRANVSCQEAYYIDCHVMKPTTRPSISSPWLGLSCCRLQIDSIALDRILHYQHVLLSLFLFVCLRINYCYLFHRNECWQRGSKIIIEFAAPKYVIIIKTKVLLPQILQFLNNVIIIKTKVLLPQILQFLNNVIIIKTKVLLPQILQFLNNVIIIKTKVLLPKPILAILF